MSVLFYTLSLLFGFLCLSGGGHAKYEAMIHDHWRNATNRSKSPTCAATVLYFMDNDQPNHLLPGFMRCQFHADPPQRPLSQCMSEISRMSDYEFTERLRDAACLHNIFVCMMHHTLTEVLADADQSWYCHRLAKSMQNIE